MRETPKSLERAPPEPGERQEPPVAGVGRPLASLTGGWLLAGREPDAIGRRPLE